MRFSRLKLAIAIALIAVTLVPAFITPTHAKPSAAKIQNILDQLQQYIKKLDADGYNVANIYIDRLQKDGKYTTQRQLFSGNDYVIAGAGDDGIADLDIYLYDENQKQIDKDDKVDAYPVVTASPKKDGTFYVQTVLAALDKKADPEAEYFFGYVIAFKNKS